MNIDDAAVPGTCFTSLFNPCGDENVYPSPYDPACSLLNFPDAIPGFAAIIGGL